MERRLRTRTPARRAGIADRPRGPQEAVGSPAGKLRRWPLLWTLAGAALLPVPMTAQQAPAVAVPPSPALPTTAQQAPAPADPPSAPPPLAAQDVPAAADDPAATPLLEPVTPMSEWAPAPDRPPRHLTPTVKGAAIGLGVGLVLHYLTGLRLWATAGLAGAGALIGSWTPGGDDGPAPRFDARVGGGWSVSLSVPTGGR